MLHPRCSKLFQTGPLTCIHVCCRPQMMLQRLNGFLCLVSLHLRSTTNWSFESAWKRPHSYLKLRASTCKKGSSEVLLV